ncbi:hypothetical protein ACJ41O_007406 [Fusarium nematophilum]
MSSTGDGQQQPPTTVAGSARSVAESFQQCLNKAACIHARELSLVEDQHARFSVWAANIRVFGSGRDSLDHRLREASDVQDAVAGILETLDYRIQTCSRILESAATESHASPDLPKELDAALEAIRREIGTLHRISNTIRRASKDTQNTRAEKSFKIRDDEGTDVESFLLHLFGNQIRDRFPGASDIIQQRLAHGMLLRRKRILYRRARYGGAAIRPKELPSQPRVSVPKAKPSIGPPRQAVEDQVPVTATTDVARSVAQTATTLSPEGFEKASAPSVISVSKTVALSSHDDLDFPPAPCGRVLKGYRRFKRETDEKHRAFLQTIPGYVRQAEPPPRIAGMIATAVANNKKTLDDYWGKLLAAVEEVTCPFCFYTLPIRDVVKETKWKLHVKGDLDPYVCLFEECDLPERLYNHSSEWLKHMRGHATRWRCSSKSHDEFIGATRDEYIQHMQTSHPGKFSNVQLGALADRNGRVPGSLFKSCPLCGMDEADGGMEDHIVGHMRFLALKSLPAYQEDTHILEDDSGSDDSMASSKPQSRSTINKHLEDDPPGPGESDSEVHSMDHVETEDPADMEVLSLMPSHSHRGFQWCFIPGIQGSSLDIENDPIMMTIYARQRLKKNRYVLDPDCAICRAPVTMNCDCEAKGLNIALKNAEERIMQGTYQSIRTWVRSHSQDYVLEYFRMHMEAKHKIPATPEQQGNQKDPESAQRAPVSKEEVNEMWQASVERYPEVLEYYYGLPELTLPAETDPAVVDPPLGSLQKRRNPPLGKGSLGHIASHQLPPT